MRDRDDEAEYLKTQLILLRGEVESHSDSGAAGEIVKEIADYEKRLWALQRASDLEADPEDLRQELVYLRREIAELSEHGGPNGPEAVLPLTDRLDEIEAALREIDEQASWNGSTDAP